MLSISCTSLGPHPKILTLPAELRATPKTAKILVLPTIGTGIDDKDAAINRVVPAAAYEHYQDLVILSTSLRAAAKALGMPEEAGPVMSIAWLDAFHRWIKAGKRGRDAAKITVPTQDNQAAKSDSDTKNLARSLSKQKKQVSALATAMHGLDGDELTEAVAANARAVATVENLHRHIIRRLKVTYALATELSGTEASYNAGKPLTLHAALVNVKTGAFRYYAVSSGKRSDLPADFLGFYTIMAKNLFEDIGDVDGIEP